MARKRHHNTISLFPFLAVLVCTMGALILLLLVTTRQIRNDWKQSLDPADRATTVQAAPPESVEVTQTKTPQEERPDVIRARAVDSQNSADIAHETAERDALNQQIVTVRQRIETLQQQLVDVNVSKDDSRKLLSSLREELSEVEAESAAYESSDAPTVLADQLQQLASLQTQESRLLTLLDETSAKLQQKRSQLAAAASATQEITVRLATERSALVSLRTDVRRKIELLQSPPADGTRTMLEFSNPTGTSRIPIVIDVTADGFEFLPDGIRITQRDMRGFPVRDNPLLSGIFAAFTEREGAHALAAQPYVLLLVRPDGCVPFYAAQRVMMESRIHFGYELVSADRQFDLGPANPAEQQAVRQAMLEALLRRDRLYAHLQPGESFQDTEENADTSDRRMNFGPDGSVRATPDSDDRFSGTRFYAGGFAPPPNSRKRPPGGYQTLNPNYRPDGQVTANGTDSGQLGSEHAAGTQTPEQSARLRDIEELKQRIAEAKSNQPDRMPLAVDQLLNQGEASGYADSGSEAAMNRPAGNPQRASNLSAATSVDADSNDFLWPDMASSSPGDGSGPDLSRIDPALLRQLNAAKTNSHSASSPVGITIFVDPNHVTIQNHDAIYAGGMARGDLTAQVLSAIDDEVSAVRHSPDEPLMPIVRFVVSPGGERLRITLARQLQQCAILSATQLSLSAYIEPSADSGMATVPDAEPEVKIQSRQSAAEHRE